MKKNFKNKTKFGFFNENNVHLSIDNLLKKAKKRQNALKKHVKFYKI